MEAFMKRYGGKVIPEIVIPITSLGNYLILEPDPQTVYTVWVEQKKYYVGQYVGSGRWSGAPAGWYIRSINLYSFTYDSYGTIKLGSYFDNIKSCKMEMEFAFIFYRGASAQGNGYLNLWGNQRYYTVDYYSQSAYTNNNGIGKSDVFQKTLFSFRNQRAMKGEKFQNYFGIIIKSLKLLDVKYY